MNRAHSWILVGWGIWLGSILGQTAETLNAVGDSIDATLLFARTARLRAAVMAGNLDRVQTLLEENPEWIQAKDANGSTLLHLAASKGHEEIGEYLLSRGLSINATNWIGDPALAIAVMNGHERMTRWFLEKKADVILTNQFGMAPLHVGAREGRSSLIELLLENGADPFAANLDGELPMELAEQRGHRTVARQLRERMSVITAERIQQDRRMRVVVACFHNETGDVERAHWRYGIAGLLGSALNSSDAFDALPLQVEFAGRGKLGLDRDAPLTAEQARNLGEEAQARRVVWGSYRFEGDALRVRARILNVATGAISEERTENGVDPQDVRDQLSDWFLQETKVELGSDGRERLRGRRFKSAEALDLFARGYQEVQRQGALAKAEEYARQMLALEPDNVQGQVFLISALIDQKKLAEAEQRLEALLKQDSDNEKAHLMRGILLLTEGKSKEARKMFRSGLVQAPDDYSITLGLGQLCLSEMLWESARFYFEETLQRNPGMEVAWARLAMAMALSGDEGRAREMAEVAARIGKEDAGTQRALFELYQVLQEPALVLKSGDQLLELLRQWQAESALVERYAEEIESWKGRLSATPISAQLPREYSGNELRARLDQVLSAEERAALVLPLETTDAMRTWARELAGKAEDEMARARAIYEALNRRIDSDSSSSHRTAHEVFEVWNDPKESFNCQEYAKLFVVLARAVELKAFMVHLERDYQDRVVYHDCAAIFVGDQAWLVDPAYHWFGVPHREFTVLDDIQALAHQAMQGSADDAKALRHRAGVKLDPNFAWSYVMLGGVLLDLDKLEEAESALGKAEELEPGRWDACLRRSQIAHKKMDFETMEKELRLALEKNPQSEVAHLALGSWLQNQGKLREAHDEYEAAMKFAWRQDVYQAARRAALLTEELLVEEGNEAKQILQEETLVE